MEERQQSEEPVQEGPTLASREGGFAGSFTRTLSSAGGGCGDVRKSGSLGERPSTEDYSHVQYYYARRMSSLYFYNKKSIRKGVIA